MLKLAVFASGGGSNFQSIAEAIQAQKLDAEVALVITNNPKAGVLQRAAAFGIPAHILNPSTFETEAVYTDTLLRVLADANVEMIALAGYLKKIPQPLISAYKNKILNIHPSLLPSFGGKGMYGIRVHQAVLAHGVRWTGVTIHLVDEAYDTGAIILQEPVPVRQDDTAEILAARVLTKEHRIYPDALQLFAENRVRITGRRVQIEGDLPRGYHRKTGTE